MDASTIRDLSFSDFEQRFGSEGADHVARRFKEELLKPGKKWSQIAIDAREDHKLHFEFRKGLPPILKDEKPDIRSLVVNGSRHKSTITIVGAAIELLDVYQKLIPFRLSNCFVRQLRINQDIKTEIILTDCWIGILTLGVKSVRKLNVERGGIGRIDCPPPYDPNPFIGSITFPKVRFPTSIADTRDFEGTQPYRALRAHLESLDNVPAANQMRVLQLRSERANDRGFVWFANWFYGVFSEYGTNPGRPLRCLIVFYFLAALLIFGFDGGGTTRERSENFAGVQRVLTTDSHCGRLARSLMLPLHAMVNPFNVFDARSLVVPNTLLGSVGLIVQGILSYILIFLTALGIRRRFKVG